MDLNHDELRRELQISKAENETAMRPWRELLNRMFDRDSGFSAQEKANALGVPGRRQFFKIGGATLLGAAVLAACSDDDDSVAETGDKGGVTGTDGAGGEGILDLTLLRTATSVEILAIDAYQTAIDSGLVTTMAVADAAKLFQSQHVQHKEALQAATTNNGGEAYDMTNQVVFDAVVKPAVDAAKSEADIAKLALDLEEAAASTYVFAAGKLSTPEFRQTIMTIGGVEARHATIIRSVLEAMDPTKWAEVDGFVGDDKRIPDAALVA
jgi:hypothetical protein